MQSKHILILALVVTLVLGGVVGFGTYTEHQKAIIEATKAVQVEALQQKQATERTEERSQFWQKLVPWGNDEMEQNQN